MISSARFFELTSKLSTIAPICVLGDVGLDKYTHGEVSRISPEAPVPVLLVSKQEYKLAMAANVSHNLSALQIKSSLCGLVGEDEHGVLFEKVLGGELVNLRLLIHSKERPTIVKERITTSMQQICRVDYEKVVPLSKKEEELFLSNLESLKGHGALLIEDYSKGLLSEGLLKKVIKRGRELGLIVAVDPGRNTPPEFYKGATLFKPNLSEAKQIVSALGVRDLSLPVMAATLLDKLELDQVVITLGKDGMALMDKKEGVLKTIPTLATEVFDVSGAGDTTISLITAGLIAGASLEEACWLGNCGAGVVVGKRGTATVSQEELLDFFEKFEKSLTKKKKS